MATPQAAVAMVAGATLTAISYLVQNLRCLFWIISALIGLAGAVMVHTLDIDEQRDASLAGVYIMGFYNVPWVFMLSLNSSNTAGATKKSFMGITVAVCYGKYRMFLTRSSECQQQVQTYMTNLEHRGSCWEHYRPAVLSHEPGPALFTWHRFHDVRFRPYGRVRSSVLPIVRVRKQATQFPVRGPGRLDTSRT